MPLDHYRLLGRSGLRVSPLCLGTMTFGTAWGWGSDKDTSRAIFDRFAERGGNFIDTANMYTGGESEMLIGEFVRGRREDFVIATKYTLSMSPKNPNAGGNHRKALTESLHASLKRLDTDYIDLYWVHAWEFRTRTDEVMRALDDAVSSGKVLYIAVSNAPSWKIAEANTLADLRGWSPFVAAQVHYNLLERSVEHELVPMAKELGVAVQPWSPLAGGVLTGKYKAADANDAANKDVDAARQGVVTSIGQLSDRGIEVGDAVVGAAMEIGASPAQVALRWVLQKPAVVAPIIGARRLDQLDDNLGCLDIDLPDEIVERLDALTRPEPIYPSSFANTDMFRGALDGECKIEAKRDAEIAGSVYL